MKNLLAIVALLAALLSTASSNATAAGGSDTPFPLDFPLPFPWGSIEGTWVVESADLKALYSFEVQTSCNQTKILKVIHIDPTTHEVVAEGIGYMSENATTVYAGMQGGGGSYFLVVGAYNEKHGLEMKRFYGLRIFPFRDMQSEVRYRISKVQDDIPQASTGGETSCVPDRPVTPATPAPTPVPRPAPQLPASKEATGGGGGGGW